jgi:hypothetical protein
LVAFLVWRPAGKPVLPTPERMTVTISDEVGMTSTSPEPAAQAAPDVAPDLGEPAPPEPVPPPPQPMARPEPPKPVPQAAPIPRPAPRPIVRPTPPRPQPSARPAPPRPQPATRPAAQPSARPVARPPQNAGASRIGSDFLKGVQGAQSTGQSRTPPAAAIGPAVQASLRSEISRQLKPHWTAPQGADAELLVTLVRLRLNRDGSLAGAPEVVGQSGETPSNAAQKARHAEQAIRAVRLAAPFKLPTEFYAAWQTVTSRFDRKLSQ